MKTKPYLSALVCLVASLGTGCIASSEEPEAVGEATEALVVNDATDATGTIHIHISTCTDGAATGSHDLDCAVAAGYVLVGGGVEVKNAAPAGALLTASFPDGDLKTWHASSKDADILQSHTLSIYAIGMRIDGISEATLRSKMIVVHQDSAGGEYPQADAYLPSGYVLTGGGAAAHWLTSGLYLFESNPATNFVVFGWHGRAKDHINYEQGYLTSYAIGVSNTLSKVCGGSARSLAGTWYQSAATGAYSGYGAAGLTAASGVAPTSPGGRATFVIGHGEA
jgi:hypothetical protein